MTSIVWSGVDIVAGKNGMEWLTAIYATIVVDKVLFSFKFFDLQNG